MKRYQDPYVRQKPRAYVTLRVPVELCERVDLWAEKRALGGSPVKSRNHAILQIVTQALDGEGIPNAPPRGKA